MVTKKSNARRVRKRKREVQRDEKDSLHGRGSRHPDGIVVGGVTREFLT